MSSRRNVLIAGLVVLCTVLLTQFQNCAPAPQPMAGSSGTDPDARVIDEFNKSQIQFPASSLQISDEASSAEITGLCSRAHNGARVRWTLWAPTGETIANGVGSCSGGGFSLHIERIEQLDCGVNFQLVAEGEWGESAFTGFSRWCQPLARQALPDAGQLPTGTLCELEYVPSDESESPCSQVCFRAGIVVSQTPLEASRCSEMASGLAGP